MECNSVCNHTSDEQNRTTAKRESDLLITSMITDWIGRHDVLLPINQNYDKIRETNRPSIERWTIEIALAASASAISAFLKTHKCKLIPNWTRKTVWLLIYNINMKKICVEEMPVDLSWSHFFSFEKTFFKVSAVNFRHHFIWYHWLRKFPIFFQPIRIE